VPPECGFVPDLVYCPPGMTSDGPGSDGGTSSDGGTFTDGGTSVDGGGGSNGGGGGGNGNGGEPPGHSGGGGGGNPHGGGGSNGGGIDAGGGSNGGGGGGGTGDGGGGFHCTDNGGHRTCDSVPVCAPGSHPAPCGACVSDDAPPTEDCTPPETGGCWVTGGGFIVDADGNDNFGGNGMPMKDGRIRGEWNHVDHGTGDHAHGEVQYLVCRDVTNEPGPGQPGGKKGLTSNQVYFGGPARWQIAGAWNDGYWFDVMAEDHGSKGQSSLSDYYHFTIRLQADPMKAVSGTVVYDTEGPLVGGKIQLHPPNGGHPFTASSLPSWVALQP
jgi:hypothetical protein